MRDRGTPGPALVVAPQSGCLGQTGLQDVVWQAGQSGGLTVLSDLHLTVGHGAGSGTALDRVVEQEAAVGVERLLAGRRPHPQLHLAAAGGHVSPALQVPAQREQTQPLLPQLHTVLALPPLPPLPQSQVHHLQLDPLAGLGLDGPDTLPAPQVVAGVAGGGDVAVARDCHPAPAVGEHPGLTGVAQLSATSAPGLGLCQVPPEVEGAGAGPHSRTPPDHGQEDVPGRYFHSEQQGLISVFQTLHVGRTLYFSSTINIYFYD